MPPNAAPKTSPTTRPVSTSKITAGRYDVMCNPANAEDARARLARFSLRN
jgi:hypothetical protein